MRRPYQNPGRPRAGAPSPDGAGTAVPAGGDWDSYALHVRFDRNHSSPVSAAGTSAPSARRRPGWPHQPPGSRNPSQDRGPVQALVPAHCQARRSSATSQAAAISSRVRLSARTRTRTPYVRTAHGAGPVAGAAGRAQWARLTTMKGRSSNHRAREPLPEVSRDQQ